MNLLLDFTPSLAFGVVAHGLCCLSPCSIVWKVLVNDEVTDEDVEAIDALSFRTCAAIEQLEKSGVSQDSFNSKMADVKFEVMGK
jgi:hypothetical protein